MNATQSTWVWWPYLVLAAGVLVAMAVWFVRRRDGAVAQQSPLAEGAGAANAAAATYAWSRLRPTEFMRLVGDGFRARGYHVVDSGVTGARADGAVDIELRRDRETYLVHCKHWKSPRIDVEALRAFNAVLVKRQMAGGFVVATGRYTHDATQFARGMRLGLIDATQLGALIAEGRAADADAASVGPRGALPKPVAWAPESVFEPLTEAQQNAFDLMHLPEVDTPPPAAQWLPTQPFGETAPAPLSPSGASPSPSPWLATQPFFETLPAPLQTLVAAPPAARAIANAAAAAVTTSTATTATATATAAEKTAATPNVPGCPLCTATMTMRTATTGKHTGRGYWRCSRPRECKGVRKLA